MDLDEHLGYDHYRKYFTDDLTEILQSFDPAEDAIQLAKDYARNEPKAVDRVNVILTKSGRSLERIMQVAQERKAGELVQEYARRDPGAVKLIHKLLTEAGMTIDALMAKGLVDEPGGKLKYIEQIERIDRLTTIAESRRNASLREIDRRRSVVGQKLRRNLQEIEEAEFKVIEMTPAKGKKAA